MRIKHLLETLSKFPPEYIVRDLGLDSVGNLEIEAEAAPITEPETTDVATLNKRKAIKIAKKLNNLHSVVDDLTRLGFNWDEWRLQNGQEGI